MKKDIENIEEIINTAKESNEYKGNKYYKSMDRIIKKIKKLQEENKNLKEINKEHQKMNGKLVKELKKYE